MADTDIVQLIAEARIDARSLSEFVFKPAGFKVTRRLAPPIDTLQFYIDRFEATKATTDAYVATIPTIVNDAINNTAIEGGILADTFLTVTPNGQGTIARTQRAKNSDFISVKDFGAKGDGVTDDTAAVQAAIDSGKPIHLGEGVYRITQTIKTKSFTYLHGLGNASVIKADNVVGAAILTYSGEGEGTAPSQNIGNFCVVGKADCAIAFAHCTVSVFSNICLTATASGSKLAFEGRYGFVFEYFWGSSFDSLFTHGSGISKSCFKFNRVILASTFNTLYTSNISEYSFEISADNEYGTGTASGHHTNIINMAVAQGATKYGLLVRGGTGFVFSKFYTEACAGSLHIKSGIRHTFNDCNFSGLKPASTHAICIDNEQTPSTNLSNITFNDCEFEPTRAIIIGSTTGGIAIFNPRTVSEQPIFPLIKRNANTAVIMNLTVHEKAGNSPQTMYEKTRNYGHKFAATYLDTKVVGGVEVSYWKDMPVVVPELTTITPY